MFALSVVLSSACAFEAPSGGPTPPSETVLDAGPVAEGASDADAGAGPQYTADGCLEIAIGQLRNGTQLPRTVYGLGGPTYLGVVLSTLGTVKTDIVTLRLTHPVVEGSFSLENQRFGAYERFLTVGEDEGDFETGKATRHYVAQRGVVRILGGNNPEQTYGELADVTLREAKFFETVPFQYDNKFVEGAACLHIKSAAWDARVAGGCDPLKPSACGAAKTCVSINAAASDGLCVASTGSLGQGSSCMLAADGSSDCAVGHRCFSDGKANVCQRVCDPLGAENGCDTDTFCAPMGVCFPKTRVVLEPTIKFGEACAGPSFCGTPGKMGVCTDFKVAGGPTPLRCYQMARSRNACPDAQHLWWLSYDEGYDTSLGYCYTPEKK